MSEAFWYFFASIAVSILLGELTEFTTAMANKIIRLLARLLPEDRRALRTQIWLNDLQDQPGKWYKVLYALSHIRSTFGIRWQNNSLQFWQDLKTMAISLVVATSLISIGTSIFLGSGNLNHQIFYKIQIWSSVLMSPICIFLAKIPYKTIKWFYYILWISSYLVCISIVYIGFPYQLDRADVNSQVAVLMLLAVSIEMKGIIKIFLK